MPQFASPLNLCFNLILLLSPVGIPLSHHLQIPLLRCLSFSGDQSFNKIECKPLYARLIVIATRHLDQLRRSPPATAPCPSPPGLLKRFPFCSIPAADFPILIKCFHFGVGRIYSHAKRCFYFLFPPASSLYNCVCSPICDPHQLIRVILIRIILVTGHCRRSGSRQP